jgi:hypothetical protein
MTNLNNEIRKRMTDFEVEPPQEIWNLIEQQLDHKKPAAVFLWKKYAAAAAILLFIASASLYFIGNLPNTSTQFANEPLADPSQQINTLTQETINTQAQAADEHISSKFADNSANLRVQSPGQPSADFAIIMHDPNEESENVASFTDAASLIEIQPQLALLTTSGEPSSLISFHQAPPAFNKQPLRGRNTSDDNVTFALAQSDPAAPSAYSFSAYFAPQHSFRYQHKAYANPMQSMESEILSFAGGVHVNYKVNNRWELQSGLGYTRLGQNVHDIASFSHPSLIPLYSNDGHKISQHPQSMSTSMGGILFTDQSLYFADVSSSRISMLKGSYDESVVNLLNKSGTGLIQHFEYLEIPVTARYKFLDKALQVYAKAGVIANYLLSSNVYLQEKSQNTPIGKSVGLSSFNFAASGGLVISYPISNHISIYLEPTASIFMRPIGQISNLTKETYPYNWSMLMGFSYNL